MKDYANKKYLVTKPGNVKFGIKKTKGAGKGLKGTPKPAKMYKEAK